MRLSFQIAWRFLSSSKVQTVLIALGIAIGVAVQVFIGTLITGLQQSLLSNTIGSSAQITVITEDTNGRISGYSSIVEDIDSDIEGITELTVVADASGFIEQEQDNYAVLFRGLDFDTADGIYKLESALVEGALPSGDQLILGTDLMDQAGLAVGDTLDMLTPDGGTHTVTISGKYDLKVANLNASWAIGERQLVQDVFGYGDEVTGIEMQVAEVFDADATAEEIQKLLPDGLTTTNWKAQNAQLLSGLNGQSVSSYMIQAFVLLSVVLAIASVLVISVLQKSRQLGILKAMGIRNRSASQIFLFEGLLLGVFGAAAGIGLGLGLAALFSKFATNADGDALIPLTISPGFVAFSALIAILAAVVASLVPAARSSRLNPIEVIQNG